MERIKDTPQISNSIRKIKSILDTREFSLDDAEFLRLRYQDIATKRDEYENRIIELEQQLNDLKSKFQATIKLDDLVRWSNPRSFIVEK